MIQFEARKLAVRFAKHSCASDVFGDFVIASPGGEMEEEEYYQQKQRVTYDVSKLINYPGFNMSPPSGVSDVSTIRNYCLFKTISGCCQPFPLAYEEERQHAIQMLLPVYW